MSSVTKSHASTAQIIPPVTTPTITTTAIKTPQLYLITNDKDLPTEKQLLNAVSQAVDAGVNWIQLRTKPSPSGATQNAGPFPSFTERLSIAEKLQNICTQNNALLFINDEVELAAACGAPTILLSTSWLMFAMPGTADMLTFDLDFTVKSVHIPVSISTLIDAKTTSPATRK